MKIEKLASSSFYLGREQLESKINPYLLQSNFLSTADTNKIIKVSSKYLLNINRFDLLAKLDYLNNFQYSDRSDWSTTIYLEHIKAFNNFHEQDGSGKDGATNFLEGFNKLYKSFRQQGFDKDISIIPIDKDGVIIDGAHRLACSIRLNLDVYCWVTDRAAKKYSYQYFMDKGFPYECVDYLILQYCALKDNTYSVLMFPAAIEHGEATKKILGKYSNIVFEKIVNLPYIGLFNLVRQIYHGEEWLGTWETSFSGAHSKTKNCYKKNRKTTLYILECDNQDNLISAKKEIRDINKIENHSVHINDTHEETLVIASAILNQNSINFLKYSKPKVFNTFYSLFYQYLKWLNEENIHTDTVCIDGSSVMSAYGIRDAQDLDYISLKEDLSSDQLLISNHNHELKYHSAVKEELILNPANHFYYLGLKFITLEQVAIMKKNRNEYPKDIIDIQLIDSHIDRNIFSVFIGEVVVSKAKMSAKLKKTKRNIKNLVYSFLK